MMIAYFLGKFEEGRSGFKWTDVIESSIFDLLKTSVLTDLKWNVSERLNRYPNRREKLNQYVLEQVKPLLSVLDDSLCNRFIRHQNGSGTSPLVRRLLHAAAEHAREGEFRILEQANPQGYEINAIRAAMDTEKERHNLRGCSQLHKFKNYQRFVDVCGELRYQGRWSHLHISPRTSVLGHSMFVATISYLFSIEAGTCEQQRVNNFMLGLFHDLPETQTRDVRGPLKKKLPVLEDTLKELSNELLEREVIKLLPPKWQRDFETLCLTDLKQNFALINGTRTPVTNADIMGQYNSDLFYPVSGCLVKAADDLSAFLESVQAVNNGCGSPEIQAGKYSIATDYEGIRIGNLDLGLLYRELSI
jgi:putative hydrolase of HD superfamily